MLKKMLSKRTLVAYAFAAVVTAGGVFDPHSTSMIQTAAAAGTPGIAPIALDTKMTDKGVYPPEMRVNGFHGRYVEATPYRSAVNAANRVAFWESEAGVLKTDNYPIDEYVYILEGYLVTTDADGTRREFRAGDTFVLPKGWAGTWDMKTHFKKILVNF